MGMEAEEGGGREGQSAGAAVAGGETAGIAARMCVAVYFFDDLVIFRHTLWPAGCSKF